MKPNKFGIHIKCKDFKKSLEFYLNFGFESIFAYGDKGFTSQFNHATAEEKYCGVTFQISNALLEIAESHIAVKPEVFKESITSSKISAMIDVDSVSEVRKTCKKFNYEIAKAEVDYPWGTRELVVRDPDRFILVFREFI